MCAMASLVPLPLPVHKGKADQDLVGRPLVEVAHLLPVEDASGIRAATGDGVDGGQDAASSCHVAAPRTPLHDRQ